MCSCKTLLASSSSSSISSSSSSSSNHSPAFPFDLGQVHVGLVTGRVALGQVLRRDFSFPKL